MLQSMGKVCKKKKKKETNQNKEPYNQFHNDDSALVSVQSLHLASSFLFSTLRTCANCFICLTAQPSPCVQRAAEFPGASDKHFLCRLQKQSSYL